MMLVVGFSVLSATHSDPNYIAYHMTSLEERPRFGHLDLERNSLTLGSLFLWLALAQALRVGEELQTYTRHWL